MSTETKKPTRAHTHGKGLPVLRRTRIIVALLCFVVALVAFVDFSARAPAPLKHAIASAQFVPSALTLATGFVISSLACLVILAVTLAIGRIYCSVLCPLGILQDVISRISAAIRRTPPYKLPAKKNRNILRYTILALTIIAIIAGLGGLALAWLDPYSNFGRIASSIFRPIATIINNFAAGIASTLGRPDAIPKVPLHWAALGALIPPIAIFTIIAIMSAIRGRLWCNTICPVGAGLSLVSRHSLWRLSIDKNTCHKCGDCLRTCKSQCIDLRSGEIDFSRCVACYDCVSVCDEHGIKYRWHGLAASRPKQPSTTPPVTSQSHYTKTETARPPFHPGQSQPPSSPPPSNRRAFITTAATSVLAATGIGAALVGRRLADNTINNFSLAKSGQNTATAPHANDNTPDVVAPPGARSTAHILAQCTACQLCISACPSHVIEPSFLEYGNTSGLMKPRLNFDKSFCNFNCTACTQVCPDGALTPLTLAAKHITRIGLAHTYHDRCVILNEGTACGACAEHCPTAALQMKITSDYPEPLPVVDPRYCIGCGACHYACPADPKAIKVRGIAKHETADVLKEDKLKPAADDFAF